VDGITRIKERLTHAEQSIKLNDPARQLKLGYSIVRSNGKILRSVKNIKIGDELKAELSDGSATSKVLSTQT
jgi:exodeoxyribonuclease VII large subunit